MHAPSALLAAAVLAACASATAAAAVPVPCCAKFYGDPGTCAASACPNKFATAAECKAGCTAGDDECEMACDTWICRDSVRADGTVETGKIDCITWGGLADGAGLVCVAPQGTAIKMSDNNGVGCPGYTGAITGKVACERSITTDFGPPEVTEQLDEAACNAVGCCTWTGSECESAVGENVCNQGTTTPTPTAPAPTPALCADPAAFDPAANHDYSCYAMITASFTEANCSAAGCYSFGDDGGQRFCSCSHLVTGSDACLAKLPAPIRNAYRTCAEASDEWSGKSCANEYGEISQSAAKCCGGGASYCPAGAATSPTPSPPPPPSAPPSRSKDWGKAEYDHCVQALSWADLIQGDKTGTVTFKMGGLGALMEDEGYETWQCIRDHYCAADAADPWFCFVYHETDKVFTPWGHNALLQLVSPSPCDCQCSCP